MSRSAPTPSPLHPLLRALWGAVLGLHVWPLWKVVGELTAAPLEWALWMNLSLLVLAMGFFAAKFAGVRWLRARSAPMGAVAFLIACGIVHGDRVDPRDPATVAAVAIVSAAGAVELGERVRRALPRRLTGAGGRGGWSLLAPALAGWLEPGAPMGRARPGLSLAVMARGPPRRRVG